MNCPIKIKIYLLQGSSRWSGGWVGGNRVTKRTIIIFFVSNCGSCLRSSDKTSSLQTFWTGHAFRERGSCLMILCPEVHPLPVNPSGLQVHFPCKTSLLRKLVYVSVHTLRQRVLTSTNKTVLVMSTIEQMLQKIKFKLHQTYHGNAEQPSSHCSR